MAGCSMDFGPQFGGDMQICSDQVPGLIRSPRAGKLHPRTV
jgi:hypothetical protein